MQTVERIFINLIRLATGEFRAIQWAVVSANLLSFKNETRNPVFGTGQLGKFLICLLRFDYDAKDNVVFDIIL